MGPHAQNAGAVFDLKYHLVWGPKYLRPVLVKPVDHRLQALLQQKATGPKITIHSLLIMGPVHLFVAADPTRCVAEMVNRPKGSTSHVLRTEFVSLRLPTLWGHGYYTATVG